MKFRTELFLSLSDRPLDPRRPITLIGSCFSSNIGKKMRESLWDARINPCGALYNPLSIGRTITNCLMPEDTLRNVIREAIIERDGVFLSWLFDSSIAAASEEEYVEKAMEAYATLRRDLMESSTLIITYGSAWVYRRKDFSFNVVANCHKFPADGFMRARMTIDDINSMANNVAACLDNRLNHLRVIITLSPVRHLGDGAEENTISKATLRLGIDKILSHVPQLDYFPAFEIMNDDLRDYRFYASDLVHPSEEAAEYIWEKFQQRYLTEADRKYLEEGRRLYTRSQHRSLLPDTETSRLFRAETDRLTAEYLATKTATNTERQ